MPPYYQDQYQDGYSDQYYYADYNQPPVSDQSYNQYVPQLPQPRIQVNVPPRQSQGYAGPSPPPPQQIHQYQYAPVNQGYQPEPVPPQQYYNQQPYQFNNQYQQQYQPLPQVQVIVPPAPQQYRRPPSNDVSQSPIQYQEQKPPIPKIQHYQEPRPPIPKAQQYQQPIPQPIKPEPPVSSMVKVEPSNTIPAHSKPRVLQEQPNMAKPPVEPTQKSVPRPAVPASDVPMPDQSPLQPAIILTLADEYIAAARKLEERSEDYHILMSTAMGCLQTTLKNLKLSPVRQAQVSLKYAQLLYDETNNLDEAEVVLTKAIDLCERMKFVDLKYALQLLFAKVLFRSKPRAAVRDLEGMIQDIVTYKHVAWEYPFRIQAVFFLLESRNHHNVHEALQHIEKMQNTAAAHSDHIVYTFAALLESLLHLRTPGPDSLSLSQQALAKARSHQLNPDVEQHAQIPVVVEFIELMWAMNTASETDTLDKKRASLKDALYASLDGNGWTQEQFTMIRVNSKSLRGIPVQVGGLIHELNGRYYLALSWLRKKELEALGFLLNGEVLMPQNYYLKGKAENFILEGYSIINDSIPAEGAVLTVKAEKPIRRKHILSIFFLAENAFMQASKGNWDKTREALKQIEVHVRRLGQDVPEELKALTSFLQGCVSQGTGDLDNALKHYQSQHLGLRQQQSSTVPQKQQKATTNNTLLELQLLATINTAFIIRLPSHPQHSHLSRLLTYLSAYFPSAKNNAQQLGGPAPTTAASTNHPLLHPPHSLLLATLPNTTILQTKSLLAASLNSARRINNSQIMSLCLTLMYDRFFRGGIQDAQAVKCAKAASHHVRTKVGSPLWEVITSCLEAESLELVGGSQEEVRTRREGATRMWEVVPEKVKGVVEGAG